MKLRIGLIGVGTHWETRHLPALRALSDRFEVRAVCDPVQIDALQPSSTQRDAHAIRSKSERTS